MKAMVIGLGRIGWSYDRERGLGSSHFGAYALNPNIDTIIAVDSDEKRLDEFWDWTRTNAANIGNQTISRHTNYLEAIKKWKPEIVSLCTPTSTHKDIMLDLCHKDGPDVICLEKPAASSVQETQEIANRAAYVHGLTKDSGRAKPKAAVNFSRRWHPNWIKVKELLDSGKIGKPLLAVGHHPGPLLRSGVHMLDLFNWYFGEVQQARSLAFVDSWMTRKYPDTDDQAYNAEIIYKNRTRAFLLGADLAETNYQLFELEIYGEKGGVHIYDNGTEIWLRDVIDRASYGGLKGLEAHWPYNDGFEPDENKENALSNMVDDLVECAKNPKRYPATGLEDGVNAQILVSMIRQSKGNWTTPTDIDWKEVVKSL